MIFIKDFTKNLQILSIDKNVLRNDKKKKQNQYHFYLNTVYYNAKPDLRTFNTHRWPKFILKIPNYILFVGVHNLRKRSILFLRSDSPFQYMLGFFKPRYPRKYATTQLNRHSDQRIQS